jgi:hypothetical protein
VTIAALAFPVVMRLVRSPRAPLAFGACAVVCAALAVAARAHGSADAADHLLIGVFGGYALPLLAYALVGTAIGSRSLAASGAPLTAFGASPVRVAVVTVLVAIAATAVASAIVAASVALLAHGPGDPPLARDALASAYAGCLGGVAYASLFSLGATFGKRGGGRATLLVIDWFLGGTDGLSLPLPRGHVRNVLGGAAPLEWSQRASASALAVLAVAYAVAAVIRAARRR